MWIPASHLPGRWYWAHFFNLFPLEFLYLNIGLKIYLPHRVVVRFKSVNKCKVLRTVPSIWQVICCICYYLPMIFIISFIPVIIFLFNSWYSIFLLILLNHLANACLFSWFFQRASSWISSIGSFLLINFSIYLQ